MTEHKNNWDRDIGRWTSRFWLWTEKKRDLQRQYQAQASEQFLASINLASNKAMCLKTKQINKSSMYF